MQRVDRASDEVLGNLFEHYMHDMAEWFEFDTNEDGAYSYPTHKVWDQGWDVFLAYSAATPIAFALVGSAGSRLPGSSTRDLKEFFVIRRHRRDGIGAAFARYVWDQYPEPWLVRVYRGNVPAVPFWRRVVADYTGDQFRESVQTVDGREWSYFWFGNGDDADEA
jgi:predicted acetyltransferase